ncbi:glycogen/starch/alpha-glucan phosphorylase [Fusobacterium varium]|jgi:starch phosphorylase|uniref:Alpha-1,4 glucan phosphorylase n=1 Tax=Fusobacterium varium ATCC 27725 TaxID=469618 RepID=A0ABN5JJZ1_FUSVA|nr:glycogen/starch/alpha-glucan phosphorylase [Fusobacterium varium]AVQ31366.1 glycogen/starch/alpha-glucan phosphorylase [Fusobacterium varium ATCC 27725]EES62692.2 phosphorylase, glycogen/starch/alpha-glucan family [Fusobacterium varium ATCC 27725]MDY4004406.1 glycogen/starch/alpha-glucan phosphorylase [Fusobacterium varium]RGJ28718.1 glycogen/starch/alpha-glucan phosphorylase [Fusobacterium varium]UYI79877.1 MAG: glycogen/starch/alpha-glucan phosphorylase [Fusobacterium varium]
MKIEKNQLKKQIEKYVKISFGKDITEANEFEIYRALGQAIMEEIAEDWYETRKLYSQKKQAFYLSAEFLMGRALGNNLINLGLLDEVKEVLSEYGIDYNKVEDEEEDSALGNGGLGRLAACFLDSLATLNLPGQGYGIRYRNGIFNQTFKDGYQVEKPETWLKYGDVWSIERPADEVIVSFGDENVRAVPYDMPIIGYGTKNINTLRLWEAHSIVDLDLGKFNQQDYLHATQEKTRAEDISRVLYPNDSTDEGKKLRLKQQYFFVSASLQDILRKFKKVHGRNFEKFSEFTAIQLNDTHPVIAIPELMRLLLDVEGVSWEKAWGIVEKTFSYTNHTILAEALEKWWVGLYEQVVPRIYQITQGINDQLKGLLAEKFPDDSARQDRMSIIQGNMIHMAWLAIYGSHTINGVAALHTEILKNKELKDWYEIYPERFQNKTNGITQRRWLLQSNPQLAKLITELLGEEWITDLSQLKRLEEYINDEGILKRILEIKHEKKIELVNYLRETQGIEINPNSIFDMQIKRLHEYKRQLLNIFHVIGLYNKLKLNPSMEFNPVTYIYGAKAAPGYLLAKGIIRLINEVAQVVNRDPDVNGKLKIVFVENYRVSVAEKLFPAADISEQISTAGKEASGTGNMKFMLNGALTIGTLDGANVEIVEEAGIENNYIFGLKVNEIEEMRTKGYDPHVPYNNVEGLKKIVDSLIDGTFNDLGTGIYSNIHRSLMENAPWQQADQYFVLEDFEAYRKAQKTINKEYRDRMGWAKKQLMNIANAGKFSSDRTIKEYADEIWHIEPAKL